LATDNGFAIDHDCAAAALAARRTAIFWRGDVEFLTQRG
jgi:hypothetical protein